MWNQYLHLKKGTKLTYEKRNHVKFVAIWVRNKNK